jgi:hypothetical protein
MVVARPHANCSETRTRRFIGMKRTTRKPIEAKKSSGKDYRNPAGDDGGSFHLWNGSFERNDKLAMLF